MRSRGLGDAKEYLPHGYGRQLAEEFGCSVSKVYKVVTGQLTDWRMQERLLEMIRQAVRTEQRTEKLNRTLQKHKP